MEPLVYLDNAATTRVDPEVLASMAPFLGDVYGNPSSLHTMGLEARRAVDDARQRCAGLLDTRPDRIVFTASGSESNNLAVRGLLPHLKGRSVITTRLEHPSVAEPVKVLERHGARVITVNNDREGRLDLNHLDELLAGEPCGLLCLIHGSNEVGTVQEVHAVGKRLAARSPDTWFHLDAVQSVGHLPMDPEGLGIHSLTLSCHKLHGPRGAGILALYRNQKLLPIVAGGGQESGRRSGTENVPAIVGSAVALERAVDALDEAPARMQALKDRLGKGITEKIEGVCINGSPSSGLCHILSVSFQGLLGEVLLHHLEEKGIMVSTGSACHARWNEVSETLKALELPKRLARGTIRFSLSRYTTEEEIDYTLETLVDRVAYLREVGL